MGKSSMTWHTQASFGRPFQKPSSTAGVLIVTSPRSTDLPWAMETSRSKCVVFSYHVVNRRISILKVVNIVQTVFKPEARLCGLMIAMLQVIATTIKKDIPRYRGCKRGGVRIFGQSRTRHGTVRSVTLWRSNCEMTHLKTTRFQPKWWLLFGMTIRKKGI